MKQVCVVVPTYKDRLNDFEQISLEQMVQVLGNYPICLVEPESLSANYAPLLGKPCNIKKFDDYYFSNTATYSELMLSEEFYRQFADYEYILIHQLDAFVFSDRLSDFCNMGYDFIGAPEWHYWSPNPVVGNGGLSLRKVESSVGIVRRYREILEDENRRTLFRKWEDNFFSYCGTREEIDYSVPPIWVANKFSVVADVENGIRNIPKNGLPFGTHAWHRMNYEFWGTIIRGLGYSVSKSVPLNNVDTMETDRKRRFGHFLLDRLGMLTIQDKKKIASKLNLDSTKVYTIYGAGDWGKRIAKLLNDLDIPIGKIVDERINEEICGRKVERPRFSILKDSEEILICSLAYGDDIEKILTKNGCRNHYKFADYFEKNWWDIADGFKTQFDEIEGVTVSLCFLRDYSWVKRGNCLRV